MLGFQINAFDSLSLLIFFFHVAYVKHSFNKIISQDILFSK